eukprot:jgi/Chlat1/2060/Chrsp17S02529
MASKRRMEEDDEGDDEHEKRPRHSSPRGHEVVFRLLCPCSKTGALIGKGGATIAQLREDTGARIRVEDLVPNCDERVVNISGTDPKPDAEDAWTPAQEALLRVFAKLCDEGATDMAEDGQHEAGRDSDSATARLVISSSQVGCLLGKGGSVISQMRESSGASIRILPRDQAPACVQHGDELLQVSGSAAAVQMALRAVSMRLRSNPPKPARGGREAHARRVEGGDSLPTAGSEVLFRVLLASSAVGGIIGKGGSMVQSIRDETGARIKIPEGVQGCEERVAVISGNEEPGAPYSPAQEGLFRVVHRMAQTESTRNAAEFVVRMLIPSTQVGCILGRGGNVIRQLREQSGATIKIAAQGQLPAVASEGDELLQLSGNFSSVMTALGNVAFRLRTASLPGSVPTFVNEDGVELLENGLPNMASYDFHTGAPAVHILSTVYLQVQSGAIAAVMAQAGAHLQEVRDVSGAKVRLREQTGPSHQRVVEIMGTPDQTISAQQLMQAFLVTAAANIASSK